MTIKKIAELAGVAPTTVSLVLKDSKKISASTKKKVLKIVEETNYYPNHSGKLLKQGKTDAIAVLSPFFQNIYKMDFVNGVEEGIIKTDYQLRLFYSQTDFESTKCKEILFGKMADVVIAMNMRTDKVFMEKMVKAKKPIVLFEDIIKGYPGVSFDNELAVNKGIEYLVKSGRKKIAISLARKLFGGYVFVDRRLSGYQKAIKEFDLNYSRLIDIPDHSLESGRFLCQWYSKAEEKPDAILCASGDITAAGFLQEALRLGVNVPDDIAVMGFDDSIVAQSSSPGLTTVRQPVHEMGLTAFNLAVDLIQGRDSGAWSRTVIFGPEVIIRQSA